MGFVLVKRWSKGIKSFVLAKKLDVLVIPRELDLLV